MIGDQGGFDAVARIDRAAAYAKRYAAKEACAKALGTGFRQGVYWRDIGVLNRPDNMGERELMRRVLYALGELLTHHGIAPPDGVEGWAAAVVERYAPLGLKKKMLVLSGDWAARSKTVSFAGVCRRPERPLP